MNVARLGLAALGAAAFAACSSSSSTPPSTQPITRSAVGNPGGGPVAAQHDPCALFSADQLSAAFGLDFAAGKTEQGALQPTCDWYDTSAGTSVVVAVTKADEANFDSDLSGPVSDEYERTSPVVGDDSVWFDPNSTDSVSLIVISGGYRYQVSIGLGASANKDQRHSQLLALAGSAF